MTHELLAKFVGIASALSPENLHCDGEISLAQARRKEAGLKAQWKTLEAEVGHSVSEDEVWREWTASFKSKSEMRRVTSMRAAHGRR